MTKANVRFALVVLALLICMATMAPADHLEGTAMTVLVTAASTVDERVERILTDSVLIYLERENIRYVVADYRLTNDEPSRRDITRLAREGNSDFVLIVTYNPATGSRTELVIAFALYLADPAIPIATARGTVPIDLTLDRRVGELLDHVIADSLDFLATSDEASLSSIATGNSDVSGDAEGESDLTASGETGTPAEPAPNHFVEIGAGYSPAVAIGETSSYYAFAHGAGGYLQILPGQRDRIAVGVSGGAVFAQASGTATVGDVLIAPLAALLTLRSAATPIGAYLGAGGGAALIRVTNPALGTFTKIAPYATANIGVKIAVLAWLGINLSVVFDAVFEGSVLLTSIVPSATIYLGL